MKTVLSHWLAAGLLALASGFVLAQSAPPASQMLATPPQVQSNGEPVNFIDQPEPKADENNAARAKSQPGNNAPFWRSVRQSGIVEGTTSLPGVEKGVLIQRFETYPGSNYATAGEAWRQVRNRLIIPYGGSLLLIVLVAIGIFYMTRGPMGHDHSQSIRRIERFTPFERSAHWLNAIAFVLLGLSGLVMAFGKFLLLPWMGHNLFGWIAFGLKTLHNFVGPLFAVSLLVIIVTFIKDNLPHASDWLWIKKGGGMLSGEEVPSHRFNAGEKMVFWIGALALGITVITSGLVLDQLIPNLLYTRGQMQLAHMFHIAASVLMLCIIFGHIYLGTIGMRGAYGAMRNGYVSEGWAQEHHELWYDDIKAGKIPVKRSKDPALKEPSPLAREA